MGRRLEVELTSVSEESCTWRAAGAKQPKGEMPATLLYDGAKAGDVVKVEADFFMDGIEIKTVHPPADKKGRSDLLEMKSRSWSKDELVTTQLSKKKGRRNDKRNNRRGGPSSKRSEAPRRPRPKRLSPKSVHKDAVIEQIAPEHRPIVDQLLRDGMPGVRKAIKAQNAEAKAANKPEMDEAPILAIAEKALPKIRLADWRDKADAALLVADEVDLRDLRSVVVAGNDIARDDESKAIATELSAKLQARIEKDHSEWVKDLSNALEEERLVAALKISSRPVKAGSPLATDVAAKLTEQASKGLGPEVLPYRWAIVLDALAFSPVRSAVTPEGLPNETSDELISEVRRLSDRLPHIAKMFGIDPATVPEKEKKRRPKPRRKPKAEGKKDSHGKDSRSEDNSKKDKQPKQGAESKSAEHNKTEPVVDESQTQSEDVAAPAEAESKAEAQNPKPEAESSDVAEETPEASTVTDSDDKVDPESEPAES